MATLSGYFQIARELTAKGECVATATIDFRLVFPAPLY